MDVVNSISEEGIANRMRVALGGFETLKPSIAQDCERAIPVLASIQTSKIRRVISDQSVTEKRRPFGFESLIPQDHPDS